MGNVDKYTIKAFTILGSDEAAIKVEEIPGKGAVVVTITRIVPNEGQVNLSIELSPVLWSTLCDLRYRIEAKLEQLGDS